MEITASSSVVFLNISLGLGFLVLVFFLVIVLIRFFSILGNVQDITESIAEITEVVNHYLWKPVQLVSSIVDKIRKFVLKK